MTTYNDGSGKWHSETIERLPTIDMCFDDEDFDGSTSSSFTNWRSAVLELSEYAHSNGTELVQLESDE